MLRGRIPLRDNQVYNVRVMGTSVMLMSPTQFSTLSIMPVNSDSYLDDLPSGRLYHQPRVLAPQTQDEQYRPIEDANVIGGPVGMGPDHHPAYNGIRQAIGEMLNAATRLEAIHRRLGRWPNYFEKYQEHRAMTPHGCSYCHRHWHGMPLGISL
jgi:hypothetical protein